MPADRNPRGVKRPKDGRGDGDGMPGGLRRGRNTDDCGRDGPGHGEGEGAGGGTGRREEGR